MKHITPPVPQIHTSPSTNRIMWTVIISLIPGVLIYTLTQGTRWLALIPIAIVTAWLTESLFLCCRGKYFAILATLKDGSATLTALLLVLSLPVGVPLWLVVIGVGFALLIGKQLYGGLGMNPFNPAMVGYAFLLISFPALMGQYPSEPLSFWHSYQSVDAITAATVLDHTRQLRIADTPVAGALQNISGAHLIATLLAQASWLAGGIYLAYKRYLDWKISVSMLVAAFITAAIFWLLNSDAYLNPFAQIVSGSLIFGAWYIATDPVTAAATPLGRMIFAVLIGIITICIRNLGRFPDGIAFAVLLANAIVPILDSLTAPRYR